HWTCHHGNQRIGRSRFANRGEPGACVWLAESVYPCRNFNISACGGRVFVFWKSPNETAYVAKKAAGFFEKKKGAVWPIDNVFLFSWSFHIVRLFDSFCKNNDGIRR